MRRTGLLIRVRYLQLGIRDRTPLARQRHVYKCGQQSPWARSLLAVAGTAVVAALNRPPASGSAPTTTASTHTAADVSAARQKFCDAYKLAARCSPNAAAMLDSADAIQPSTMTGEMRHVRAQRPIA